MSDGGEGGGRRLAHGPEHFARAAASLGAPPLRDAHWEGVHVQEMVLPPGGWLHPGSAFVRLTVPLAAPGRVRRKLAGDGREWRSSLKRPGNVSLTPPGADGQWEWLDPSHFGLLFLPEALLKDAVVEAGLARPPPSLRPVFAEPDDVVGAVFKAVVGGARSEGRQSRLLISSAAHFLTRYLLQTYALQGHAIAPATAQPLTDARLNRVIDAVEGALGHDWSVDEMAAQAGISPFWFAHLFSRKVGVSPRAFVQQRRLQRAKRMLASGHLPIAQVAAQCGFPSQSWFTTCFRKTFGTTPATYRRIVA